MQAADPSSDAAGLAPGCNCIFNSLAMCSQVLRALLLAGPHAGLHLSALALYAPWCCGAWLWAAADPAVAGSGAARG